MYVPSESVVVLRCNPVSIWVAVTEAPEIVAPLGSRIAPRMLPVISCANGERTGKSRDTRNNIHFDSNFMMDPLELSRLVRSTYYAKMERPHRPTDSKQS